MIFMFWETCTQNNTHTHNVYLHVYTINEIYKVSFEHLTMLDICKITKSFQLKYILFVLSGHFNRNFNFIKNSFPDTKRKIYVF